MKLWGRHHRSIECETSPSASAFSFFLVQNLVNFCGFVILDSRLAKPKLSAPRQWAWDLQMMVLEAVEDNQNLDL